MDDHHHPAAAAAHSSLYLRDAARGDHHYVNYAANAPAATAYHRAEWLDAVEDGFDLSCYRLLAERHRHPVGILPLAHVRSVLFGNYLVSVPFGNFGGIVADDAEVEQALFERAAALAEELGCKWIEFRHIEAHALPLAEHTRKVRQIVTFPPTAEAMWEQLDKQMRKHVRKAEKSGLTCEFADREGLDDFYAVFARNMRDLGTPVYSKRFFQALWDHMPDALKIVTVRLDEAPIASLMLMSFRKQLESPWASSLREYNHLCPNNLMFWETFQYAIARGYECYDFGTSDRGGGVYTFKKQWGAKEHELHRQFWLAPGQEMPHLNPSNPKYAARIRRWQRLPLWLANAVGPILSRKLP